ncbi:unnamed protein product [Penicillium salamii]|nr:unnamed protein product [Penicillium salamii]CAG8025241.1 unnamed protein product [Penicillium salamii]
MGERQSPHPPCFLLFLSFHFHFYFYFFYFFYFYFYFYYKACNTRLLPFERALSSMQSSIMNHSEIAWPMADPALTQDILTVLQQCTHYRQVRRGANEVAKAIRRLTSELVILAADAVPIAIVMHLPLLCEEKNISYVYVPSKIALGRACGVGRAVVAATITSNEASDLFCQINLLKDRVDMLAI